MTRQWKPAEDVDIDLDKPPIAQTDKAVLVQIWDEEVWLPKSQIKNLGEILEDLDDPTHMRDCLTVTIPDWLARSRGWE